jgi:small subunit ribosomal protein S8
MINDTISDVLTRIRNANLMKHQIIEIPFTKISISIAKILKDEGFIENFDIIIKNFQKKLFLSMKYEGINRQPVILNIKRVSKPGLRIYSNNKNLPKILGNLGIAIISTSQGLMSNNRAKKLCIGGEIICYLW